jgi:hypothetical protein
VRSVKGRRDCRHTSRVGDVVPFVAVTSIGTHMLGKHAVGGEAFVDYTAHENAAMISDERCKWEREFYVY